MGQTSCFIVVPCFLYHFPIILENGIYLSHYNSLLECWSFLVRRYCHHLFPVYFWVLLVWVCTGYEFCGWNLIRCSASHLRKYFKRVLQFQSSRQAIAPTIPPTCINCVGLNFLISIIHEGDPKRLKFAGGIYMNMPTTKRRVLTNSLKLRNSSAQ